MIRRFAELARLGFRQAVRLRSERWFVPTVAFGLFLLVYGSWQLDVWGSWSRQTLIGDAFCYPVDVAAVWAFRRASQRAAAVPRIQRAWRLLSLAAFVYLLGDVTYNVYDLLGIAPYPSADDGLYLGFYPVMLVGLLSFRLRHRSRGESLRLWMDVSLVALAFSAAVIYLILGPNMHQAGSSSLQSVFSVAYPVGDMVLLVGLSTALMHGSVASTKRSLQLLAGALTVFIAADLGYGYMTTHAGYAGGDGVDVLWVVAFGLFALAGTAQQELDATEQAETGVDRVGWLPFAAVAFGFGVLLYVDRDDAFYPGVAMTLVAMTLAAVLSIRLFLGQRELLEAQQELSHRALHDHLTGLANRMLLHDRLDQTLARGGRSGSRVAVMLLDVDEFKLVNDRFGHAAGDELLVQLARRLRSILRDGETIARLGGDEFAIAA